jgi:hypothetical protein
MRMQERVEQSVGAEHTPLLQAAFTISGWTSMTKINQLFMFLT